MRYSPENQTTVKILYVQNEETILRRAERNRGRWKHNSFDCEALETRGEASAYMELLPIFGILRTCAFAGVNSVDRHSYFATLKI